MEELNDKQSELLLETIKAFLKEKGIVPPDDCQMMADIEDGKIVDVKFIDGTPHKIH